MRKKSFYFENLIISLQQTTDTKMFWKTVNLLKINNVRKIGKIAPEVWMSHFKDLLNPPLLTNSISFAIPQIVVPCLDMEFSKGELELVLNKTKVGKAPGFDRVPYEFFKYAPSNMIEKLLKIYNNISYSGEIPSSFKKSIVYPLFKKGDINDVKNYRGLSFIDCISKLFTSLLNNRLYSWIQNNDILTEFQAGFRKGFSTVDNIFSLSNMIHLRFKQKEKLYCFFVDFSSAFDTIDRRALVYK